MATDLQNLQTIKSGLLSLLATETTYQLANGAKPSYSLDGESVQWTEWRDRMITKIGELNRLIQDEQSPFMGVSRMTG
jgi:hypothetical protein